MKKFSSQLQNKNCPVKRTMSLQATDSSWRCYGSRRVLDGSFEFYWSGSVPEIYSEGTGGGEEGKRIIKVHQFPDEFFF